MLEGEAILVDDSGRTPMKPGDCASFPKNDGNGHHLVNESAAAVRFLVVGANGFPGAAHYPDIDLFVDGPDGRYQHKDARSEERRVGKECVSTCRSRGSPEN